MTKLTIDERILVDVLDVLDTTISLLESSKSMHFPRIISAYNDLRSAMYNSTYNADPSCTTVSLAEMILSDCGCSFDNTSLVSRVANRIDTHIQAEKQVPEHQSPMPFVPWSKEAEMMESWTHDSIKPVAWRSRLASGSYAYCNTPEYFDNAEPIYASPVASPAVPADPLIVKGALTGLVDKQVKAMFPTAALKGAA